MRGSLKDGKECEKSPPTEDCECDVSTAADINKSKWQSDWAMKEFLSWGSGSHGRILNRKSPSRICVSQSSLWTLEPLKTLSGTFCAVDAWASLECPSVSLRPLGREEGGEVSRQGRWEA